MPETKKYDLLQIDGGLNESDRPTHIGDNEAVTLENFFVRDKSLTRRSGTTKITASAYAQKLTALYAYRKAVGTWLLMLGARQSIAKLDGTSIVALPHVDGTVFTDDANPWSFRQYADTLYAARKNVTSLQRSNGTEVMDAGIPAPTAAASVAEGAAGNLAAGTYKWVVTFTNLSTGTESDFFATPGSAAIGASKKADLTGIPTSTNAQVTGRNVYRTLKDATGEYFFVGAIENNFSTTFVDNIADANLLDAVSVKNGLPPSSLEFIEIWRERLWGHDGRDLYASRIGFPEQFDSNFLIQVFPDDGHKLRGIKAYGDRFLVGKTNAVHYLVGTDVSDFELHTLSDKHGVGSGHSMAVAEGVAFWLGMDDFYMTDGQAVRGIGTQKIRTTLEAIPSSLRERAVSYIVPSEGWYVTTIPQDELTGFDLEVVYNYKTNTWQTFTRGSLGAPFFAGEYADVDFNRIEYAVFDSGHLYQINTGNQDDGVAITAKIRTKSFGFEGNNLLKWLRKLHILCDSIAENLTVRIYRDEETTALSSREIYLLTQRPWKRVGISNRGLLGATISIELEYSGRQPFEINALAFELIQMERSTRAL